MMGVSPAREGCLGLGPVDKEAEKRATRGLMEVRHVLANQTIQADDTKTIDRRIRPALDMLIFD